jgi:hypothetical protein
MEERILITSSVFTIKPTLKFAETMSVPTFLWEEMYYKYKTMNYSKADLKEWFEFKTQKYIAYKTICRWVVRQELYDDVRDVKRKGCQVVNAQFFTRNIEEAKNPQLLND